MQKHYIKLYSIIEAIIEREIILISK